MCRAAPVRDGHQGVRSSQGPWIPPTHHDPPSHLSIKHRGSPTSAHLLIRILYGIGPFPNCAEAEFTHRPPCLSCCSKHGSPTHLASSQGCPGLSRPAKAEQEGRNSCYPPAPLWLQRELCVATRVTQRSHFHAPSCPAEHQSPCGSPPCCHHPPS